MFLLQISFQIRNCYFLEMKDTCSQCGISLSIFENINKMLHGSSTAGGNNRHREICCQLLRQFNGKTLFCSIMIHGSNKDLAGTKHYSVLCPVKTKPVCFCSSSI